MTRRFSAVRAAVLGALVAASLAAFTVPAAAATNGYVSTPVAGWSVNGQVRAVLTVGSRVYVGGTFTSAISPLGTRVTRTNIAAFDVRTGDLVTTFVATTDGLIRAMATDGTSLYLGGNFLTVNGTPRARLAAIDLTTGALRTDFAASASADVYDVEVVGTRVFAVGGFTSVNGVSRRRIAALDTTTGAVDPTFTVGADALTRSLALAADGTTLWVGGRHTVIGGVTAPRLAAIDLTTNTVAALPLGFLADEILDVAVSPDGAQVFGAVGGAANLAAAWDTTTGVRQWYKRTEGDVQAIEYAAGNVWFGFHEGAGGDMTVRLLGVDAITGDYLEFRPTIDSFYGVWDIDATDTNLTIGGEFRTVAGVATRGYSTFLGVDVVPRMTLIPTGSAWRYNDLGTDQGTTWVAPEFDDSTWPSGVGQLGYGDGDEATVIGWGPVATRKAITTYFRHTFTVTDAARVPGLTINLVRDDGAVVYVNGVEVVRTNMPAGPILSTTRASVGANPENAFNRFDIPASALVEGTNVIAVEIHQDSPSSSDLSFELSLTT